MDHAQVICELTPRLKTTYYHFYLELNDATTRSALHKAFDKILASYTTQSVRGYAIVFDEFNPADPHNLRVKASVRFDDEVVYTFDIDKHTFHVQRAL